MKRKRFTEEQIIGVLKEAEAGAKPADLAPRHRERESEIARHPLQSAGWRSARNLQDAFDPILYRCRIHPRFSVRLDKMGSRNLENFVFPAVPDGHGQLAPAIWRGPA